MTIIPIEQVKRRNRDAGFYFFEPDTMRFFRSRAPQTAVQSEDKAYFVTSERFDDRSPRLYTVRVCNLSTGDIDTVGKFQGYATSAEARRAIKGLIESRKTQAERSASERR